MKIFKPKFWNSKLNFFSIILLPLSFLFKIMIFIKKIITKEKKFKIPIICIGNIYLGGTGKTPLSIFLGNELIKRKKEPVIVRKFYLNHKDEHDLIKENFKNFLTNRNRTIALSKAEEGNFDSVILDDGFQDLNIKKDLNILCFNQDQLIGNGYVLPAGPLREDLSAIKKTDIVIINGDKNKFFEEKLLKINQKVLIYYSKYTPQNINDFKEKKLFVFAGIGNPENFFKLLENNNLKIHRKFKFPDHYILSKKELINIIDEAKKNNCQILTTEKDYYRIKDYKFDEIKYLKIKVQINNKEKLIDRILKVYD
tara:strand:- start:2682 stop:3614 length:933 start_codon:yes stop_codon:yes gene_type:complete